MFKSVIKKFDKYLDLMETENLEGFNGDLWTEVNKRLTQLEWLYERISRKHAKCLELQWREVRRTDRLRQNQISGSIRGLESADSRKVGRLMFEIQMFTESFYYLAGRMRTAIRKGPLPGLGTFECTGARNVRNKLLEHPEGKDSQVFLQSFGVGGEAGPTLKVERPNGQEMIFPDAGLWSNAAEIKNNLEVLLDRAASPKKKYKH
jgi:hypothetical protein